MPGFVIHIAVAREYMKKHSQERLDKDFIRGVIAPDLTDDKSKTHYGEDSSTTDLKRFLDQNTVTTNFKKGYFIHLLTDYEFYQKDFKEETMKIHKTNDNFYDDYDKLNGLLQEKYKIEMPQEVKEYAKIKEGTTKYLSYEKVCNLINTLSEYSIEDQIKSILQNGDTIERGNNEYKG